MNVQVSQIWETPIRALERQPIHEPERFMPFTGTQ